MEILLIDNSIYSGKPTSQVVFFRRSLRKLCKYKRLYNNNMHAGYMRCIYIYKKSLACVAALGESRACTKPPALPYFVQ